MATPKTIAFHTLGCKLNFSETSSIRQQFESAGYGVVDFKQDADIYVVNTCSVTDFADRKCRNIARKAKRTNPDAKVIMMGCYAQLKPEEITQISEVDLVVGAKDKFRLLNVVNEMVGLEEDFAGNLVGDIADVNTFDPAFSIGDRTRTFLKVQDGCDYKCTFCTIPQARGRSRSDTVANIVERARILGNHGVKEIVLTGVNIGDFGNGTEVIEGVRPKKEDLFIDLISALDQVENIKRFRISSIEPNLCSDEIIEFVAQSDRFVPHFHMPLQSGSNAILAQMQRRYKRELYADRVAKIKTLMPHACIGVDVIVGFPGETDEHYLETYHFIEDLPISYLHVFTYSERDNTPAASMDGVIDMHLRRKRNEMLRNLSKQKKAAFYQSHGSDLGVVLFEKENKDGYMYGFTDNYLKVRIPFAEAYQNTIVDVKQSLDSVYELILD